MLKKLVIQKTEVTRADRNPTWRLSKINNTENNHIQNIHKKLHSISPANQFGRQGKSLSKTIKQKYNKQLYAATEDNKLQEEINKLKDQQIANEHQQKLIQHTKPQTYLKQF